MGLPLRLAMEAAREQCLHGCALDVSRQRNLTFFREKRRSHSLQKSDGRSLLRNVKFGNLELKVLLPVEIADARRGALEGFGSASKVERVKKECDISRIKASTIDHPDCGGEVAREVCSRDRMDEQSDSSNRLLRPATRPLDDDVLILKTTFF
ncbi:MAG: hypothetical protein ABL886_10810 [Rhodoglobus sp.]